MSITGGRKSTIGLDNTGKPKAPFVPTDHPKAMITHPHAAPKAHSGMQDVTSVKATPGKAPKPKHAHLTAAPVHNGMHTKSRATGAYGFGGDDLSRMDADPASPMNGGPPAGKRLTPPAPAFGQRSRVTDSLGGDAPGANHKRGVGKGVNNELGQLIIRQALSVAGPDHPGNLGIGTLSDTNSEN